MKTDRLWLFNFIHAGWLKRLQSVCAIALLNAVNSHMISGSESATISGHGFFFETITKGAGFATSQFAHSATTFSLSHDVNTATWRRIGIQSHWHAMRPLWLRLLFLESQKGLPGNFSGAVLLLIGLTTVSFRCSECSRFHKRELPDQNPDRKKANYQN